MNVPKPKTWQKPTKAQAQKELLASSRKWMKAEKERQEGLEEKKKSHEKRHARKKKAKARARNKVQKASRRTNRC